MPRSAVVTSSAWASAFGAVSELARPPWFSALPRSTARIASPSRSAAASGLSTTAPTPSPRTYPSASLAKVLHRPSGLSIPARCALTKVSTLSSRLTPPATAASQAPDRMASTARWTATSELEQAVSTGSLGPRRSSTYEMRLASIECALPVEVNASGSTPYVVSSVA